MYSKDYIMRQIEMFTRAIANMVYKRDSEEVVFHNLGVSVSEGENLSVVLKTLVRDGKYCEAEDKLFFYLEDHPYDDILEIAIEFYRSLNEKSDSVLSANNFSRDEIAQGLESIEEIISRNSEALSKAPMLE